MNAHILYTKLPSSLRRLHVLTSMLIMRITHVRNRLTLFIITSIIWLLVLGIILKVWTSIS